MNPIQQNTSKQLQSMINFPFFSLFNQKNQNTQSYTNIIPIFPNLNPQQQSIINNPILENQNLILNKENSYLTFNNINENNPIKINDIYHFNNGYYFIKPFTTMNYYVNPLINNNLNLCQFDLLEKKTQRNKIIINNKGEKINNFDNENYTNNNFINNIKILNNKNFIDLEEENDKFYNTSVSFKMNDSNNGIMFETHLLKSYNTKMEKKYKCKHPHCDLCYKTKKQLVSHHGKMDIECQRDTVWILKLIAKAKKEILKLIKNNILNNQKVKKVIHKYENLIKKVSVSDYAQMICGNKFHDIIISTTEINNFPFYDFQKRN